ncbi:MerR family transcriptional regulator [Anaeromicropila populeti]|uniref:DNA-binding transcriptional regulator, MerR family n=1 Tax=Anaeromicropila populeti TaxID=37658 RepID=A0A1I6I7E7_9FIRM|nr:MerR family transcriptional regulator [Anaeromicropila populeti]SFR62662.1 DNA-binding transcriptional regulator, MerR family [Anaeromicropila populeti]
MSQIRYIISDASKKIDVEPHVLRYWEDELGIKIPRNEMGHRYYREQDIEMFKGIKLLKEQGFQLRAIKMVLSDISKIGQLDEKSMSMLKDELNAQVLTLEQTASEQVLKECLEEVGQALEEENERCYNGLSHKEEELFPPEEDKMTQFKVIMSTLIMDALRENNKELSGVVGTVVSESVLKEMDYMMRMKEEREEERFKKLDEAIRSRQKSRREVAATEEKEKKKKKGFFSKKKKSDAV